MRPTSASPRRTVARTVALVFLASTVAFTAGCMSPVAAGLDDAEANRVVVALEARSLLARREPDGTDEGRFRVVVSDTEASEALRVLADEGLPRPRSASLADVGRGALIPSLSAERAAFAAGLGGELEKSLLQVDGVLSARVHLNLPSDSPLREKKERSSASVLLTYRGAASPLAEAQVKKLVAAGAPELAPEDVVVVAVPRLSSSPGPRPIGAALARVGPLAVATGSAMPLRLVLAALILLVGLLASATLALYVKLSRLQRARS